MKRLLLSLFVFVSVATLAQTSICASGRYHDLVFSGVTVNTVTYSSVTGMQMDIYQPAGDVLPARPLIVLAHGGSFINGNRTNDLTIDSLCVRFAERGYVTASIDYRLGNIINLLDSVNALHEMLATVNDFKAAVRYFYKDASASNTYKIDTSKIFIGGNSSGAIMAMHYAFIDSEAETPANYQGIMDTTGGIDGNAGNPGYSYKIKAVINLAGGLNVPEFIGPGSMPIVSAQGDADATDPYYCAQYQSGLVPLRLCGLGSLQPLIATNVNYYASLVFPGDGHVPWSSDASKYLHIDTFIANFLLPLACAGGSVCNAPTINQEACLVSSDTGSTFNTVVWEKANKYATDSFYIYRAVSPDTNYIRVGAIGRDSLSVYDDVTSNPDSVSYRYKIATLDTCGNHSALSPYHQTMLLTYTGSGNFQWTPYEVEGSSSLVSLYEFYFDSLGNGDWQVLAYYGWNQTTANDPNYLLHTNGRYKVVAQLTVSCNPSRSIQTISSNIIGHPLVLGVGAGNNAKIVVAPNPTRNYAEITLMGGARVQSISLVDELGNRLQPQFSLTGTAKLKVDLTQVAAGIYYVVVNCDNALYSGKLVKY